MITKVINLGVRQFLKVILVYYIYFKKSNIFDDSDKSNRKCVGIVFVICSLVDLASVIISIYNFINVNVDL